MTAGTVQPLYRVFCPDCFWMGDRPKPTRRKPTRRRPTRRKPTARRCPWCGRPGEQLETWWQVGRASDSIVYLLHFHWPAGVVRDPADRDWLVFPDGRRVRFHADHYLGATCDWPRREGEHLSGRGAKVVAAAIALGAEPRLVRTWRVPLAFEQQLRSAPSDSPQSDNGQRFGAPRSLRPLCPEPGCAGEAAWRHYPEAKIQADYRQLREKAKAKKEERRAWVEHCAQLKADGTWDAARAWDEAFPHLAHGSDASAQPSPLEVGHAAR
jgi:hypothetical protein